MNPLMELTADEIQICLETNCALEDAQFLKTLTGRPVGLLEFTTDYARTTRTKGICSYIDDQWGKAVVLEHYDRFQQEGKLFFRGDWEMLNEVRTVENGMTSVKGDWCDMLGLLSTTSDGIELVKLAGTSWANCSITTAQLIAKLEAWHRRFGIKIFGVTDDLISAQIINRDLDYTDLATQILGMCADPQNRDITIEEYADRMKSSGEIHLWWD